MVQVTSCGPSTPANTPPAMPQDSALGRNAALAPSAAAKRNDCTTAAYSPAHSVARQYSGNDCSSSADAPSSPARVPHPPPAMNAARRPWRRDSHPTGRVPAAMPTTNTLIGTVVSAGSGDRVLPMMAPVAKTTEALAPASACAAASRSTLALARRFPVGEVSAASDIKGP